MNEVQMRKFKRKMLDVIDDILGGPTSVSTSHFQPIEHNFKNLEYPHSVSSYSDSTPFLTSPIFMQDADTGEEIQFLQKSSNVLNN